MDEKKVVIMEQNPQLAQIVSSIIEELGYRAICAENGLDGIDKVYEEDPDFIVLNPAIADINGCNVHKLLKNDPKFIDTPFLILIESERDRCRPYRCRLFGADAATEQDVVKFTTEEELKVEIVRLIQKIEKQIAVNRFQIQSEQFKLALGRLAKAYQINQDLASEQAREAFHELLNKIITILDSELGSVMLLEEEAQELVIKAAKGLSEDVIEKGRVKVGVGISGWVAKHGSPILVRDIEKDKRFSRRNDKKYYTTSLLSAPIRIRENVVGVININNKSSKAPFTEYDLSLFTILTNEISMVIENSHLNKELQEAYAKLQRLKKSRDILVNVARSLDDELYELTISQQVSNIIYSRLDYKEIGAAILEMIERLMDCQVSGLLFLDEEKKAEVMVKVKYPVTQEEIDRFKSKMIATFNDLSGGRLSAEEIKISPLEESNIIPAYTGSRDVLSSYQANSLLVGDKPFGVLAITNSFQNAFTSDDSRICSIIARHSSMAINNALLHKKLKELSITDGLTGLYCYRYFNDALEKEVLRGTRYQQTFSLLMLDIDGFKRVNDNFGHPQGDEVLKELALILKRVCRQVDIISRYGGEEFTIILPETDMEGTFILAERIRVVVKNYAFGPQDRPINLTVSIGVANYPESATSKSELIKEVDKALYKAKADGKNKVCRV